MSTKFDVSAAVAGLRVAEEQLRVAQRYNEQPVTEVTECPLCGLHPHDFTVEEYEREVDRLQKVIDGLRASNQAWAERVIEERTHQLAAIRLAQEAQHTGKEPG